LDLPPVTHASGPSARPRSPKPSSEESREARASQFTRPATVTISRRGGPNWRDYIGWGAFVAVVMIGASYIAYRRSLPPPPPQIANPIQKAADRWRDSGLEGMPVRDAIAIGKTKLERSRLERLDALETIKRGLITDANAAEAIALYARALASLPSARDEDSVSLALRGITASIGADPDSEYRADLEESRAWLLLEERRLDQARDAAARSMELSPTSPGSRLVRAATDAEFRAERSVETLRELTREPEVRNRAQRWLAVALLRSGELAEAIRILEQGAESAPNSDEMMRTLYQLRYAMGQERKARELLERLVETKNASVEDRVRLARELLSNGGDPQAALEVLDGGLAENVAGDRAAAQLYAEKIFVATRAVDFIVDPRELTQWLARGLELAPDSSAVLYARCLADTELDRREQALAGLEVANGLYPEIPEMAIDLAWRLRRVDAPAAREVIDDALISTLDSVPLYLMSALLELDGGRPVTAFQRLKRALAIDPELNLRRAHDRALPAPLEVYRQIGDELTSNGRDRRNAITSSGGAAAYYVAGDFRRASRALVQAIRIDRRSAPANLYTGILALRKNQRASAQRHINVAWEQDRGLPLVQIYHARLLENSDNLVKAELSYRDILHLNPSATSAQTGLARVLWRAGRRSEALAEVRKVLSVRPHDREALVFMAGAQGVMPAAGRRRSNR
ncbi:MAG: tetratricopeptide repeat protein, partial [Myxococcota bacterium]